MKKLIALCNIPIFITCLLMFFKRTGRIDVSYWIVFAPVILEVVLVVAAAAYVMWCFSRLHEDEDCDGYY